ncbi:hypothetical protein SV7mr_24970 [Stieleria bergensis]|uniref:DUF11 domain-containing protein n=1 Tax=Stieleria bergensis TaxID=2528025 RepID=A0A517SV56_9BACT|nr:hypothetical protein SV7mr_24970 [Planctomycetes bacterium SV_7m_r]
MDEQTDKSGFAMTAVIKLPKGEIVAGDTVLITVCATNASDDPLATPLQEYSNFERNALGGLQCWIERLGPETEIAAIPAQIVRTGNRYAAGGFPSVNFASKLEPGKSAVTQKKVKTEGFPAGQYRYYIDLQPFSRNIPKTSAVLQFTVK